VADECGDTLAMLRAAERFQGEAIAFCGVKFMAEMAKVLNPTRAVVCPDAHAGCSLVDSCPVEAVRTFKKRNPQHAIVSYMNTATAVKAESDVLCTASNAVAIVNSIPAEQPILFVPDINLGNWVKQQTGRRNMQIWQGACILHATFSARRLTSMRSEHPEALVAAHPQCSSDVLRRADFIGSNTAIVDWCGSQRAIEFIVCTESGILQALEKQSPEKRFYFVTSEHCNCNECPYMRMNTLEKLLNCLQTMSPCIHLEDDIMERARKPYERMLQVQ
jgi:quinolinate synthase